MARKFNWKEAIAGGGLSGVTKYLNQLIAEGKSGRDLESQLLLAKVKQDLTPKERALSIIGQGPEATFPGLSREQTEIIGGLRKLPGEETISDRKLKIMDKVQNPMTFGLPSKEDLMILYPPNIYNVEADFYEKLLAGVKAKYQKQLKSGKKSLPGETPGQGLQKKPLTFEQFLEDL